jgi:hypothetical protein
VAALFPYFNCGTVELTLPQDHTLFTILQHADVACGWKAEHIRDRGGMLLTTDYAHDQRLADGYRTRWWVRSPTTARPARCAGGRSLVAQTCPSAIA